VAKHRGLSSEALGAVADGRVLLGQQAIDAGLADGRATVAERINHLRKPVGRPIRDPAPPRTVHTSSAGDIQRAAQAYQRAALAKGRNVSNFEAIAIVTSNPESASV
jgi:ClpP class serine protease